MTATGMRVVQGMAVSEGVAIGRVVVLEREGLDVYRLPLAEGDVPAELERFREAVRRATHEIEQVRRRASRQLGDDLAGIFEAHGMLLSDAAFLERVEGRIRNERVNAEWAVHRTAEDLAERFARFEVDHLRERGEDVLDVSRHLLRTLQGVAHHELSEVEGNIIIVADDLTPSDAVRLGREGIVGFAVAAGGLTSHSSIIARSLHIPAVVGLAGVTEVADDDVPVVLDGVNGRLVLHPTPDVLAEYERTRASLVERERDRLATCELAAVTRDGVAVALMANIDLPEEMDEARRYGAAGFGLYRSEFLYIERYPDLPSEEDHLAIYRRLAETAAPHPAIIRTYDLGGRKLAREVMETEEDNPVLGLRGIRLMLARPNLFRTQLRAIFRAASHGDVWVMIPMVTTVEEVRRFRAFASEVMDELAAEGVPFGREVKIGIMIEVPASALVADLLAREVDFFSIGTNDLIQYALAVDRNNEHVAALYQPLHPGLVRLLRFVLDSARAAGIEVSICGEMAADPRLTPLLLALGLRRFSVSPRQVPTIKTQIRTLSVRQLGSLVDGCTALATAAEVEQYLETARRRLGDAADRGTSGRRAGAGERKALGARAADRPAGEERW